MRTIYKTLSIAFVCLLFLGCEEEPIDPGAQRNVHLIFEFSPLSGKEGTVVVIQGVHFSEVAEQNNVYFGGGAKAEVLGSTANSLTTLVPSQAVTGKISVIIDGVPSSSKSEFIIQ